VRIGMVDPLTGILSALAASEVEGAKYAVEIVNKSGGILGRPVELLVEDSANDVGTGVQKTRKLIERDKVDVIFGDVNSGIAYAMAQVTGEMKVFHIVPGGHTDPITGTDCKWNVFRICNTTSMDAAAVTGDLIKRFGKRFFFITPDYAYGHTLQDAFIKNLKAAGGEFQAELLPISTAEFSATLIKAKAYKPNVLLNNMGGLAQINCMKQFVQFGMQKDMALGGALFELEGIKAVPKEAQTGTWSMEWWWDQPKVPEVKAFVTDFRKVTGKTPSARHWFGYVAVQSVRLGAERAKSLEGPKLSLAMEGMELPPDVALQPGKITYRAGDHQLMSNIFVGDVHPPGADGPDDVCTITTLVPGEQAAGTVEQTGCKMVHPA
ncbi:MAG TPA: ABC transporter substrate-binding protein, partial [Verrucomicrobiae bacterium]|nr:ABC transporter substrate-binding protein [Verrucomicrobiae bacterium]